MDAKLRPPAARPELISRERVLRMLDADPVPPILSIVAPAGCGKTALLAQWASREDRRAAWLTLDALDNDPTVLVAYLAAAIDGLAPGGVGAVEAVRGSGTRIMAAAVPHLAAALHRLDRLAAPAAIALDDAHRLTDVAALDALAALLEHLPPHVRVAMAGRTVPGLPLARYRVLGRLREIGRTELALDPAEVSEVAAGCDRRLTPSEARSLAARTEGWAVAVHLAASHALPVPEIDASALPEASGQLTDYIRSEMLVPLDARDASFLARTSILDLVEPDLADAVAGTDDAARRLGDLAAAGQLITRVRDTEAAYRYHTLLRECLARELDRTEPGSAPGLHRRAMAWYAAAGRADLAVEHALRAGDTDAAADLVASAALATLYAGHRDTLDRWVACFGDADFERNTSLAIVGAWVDLIGGRPEEADRLAAMAERSTPTGTPRDGSASFPSARAMLRAVMVTEGPEQVLRDASVAVAEEPPTSPWRTLALTLAGSGHQMLGDDASADAAFAEAAAAGHLPGRMLALACRAGLAAKRRDWVAAEHLAHESRDVLEQAHLGSIVTSLRSNAMLARLAIRRGDVTRGREALVRAQIVRPLASRAAPWIAMDGLLELARAYLALSDVAGAQTVLAEAEAIDADGGRVGALAGELVELRGLTGQAATVLTGASTLSRAELRVLPLLPTHLSFAEIAERLYLSRHTVKTQALSIYAKLEASSRSEAVDRAVKIGLLEPFPGYDVGRVDADD